MTPPTRIQLCGPTVIEHGGHRVEDLLPGRQGRLLAAYLVVNRHRPSGREALLDAVWSGQLPSASESGLNALISKVRKALGQDILEGRSKLQLRLPAGSVVDVESAIESVHRAESQIALGDWKRAWGPSLVALLVAEREFLPGEDAPWVDEQRRLLADIRLRALETYAAAALGLGGTELAAAARAGWQLVRLAPFRESGYRLLMQALASQGNVAEALLVYGNLREVLRDELGVSPCAATQEVYEHLLGA